MSLPFAEAAEQNKTVIFEAIKPYLTGDILEIGSGTGQHAVFFASQIPEIRWQTSELESSLPVIEAWIRDSKLENLPPPIELDVLGKWPEAQYDVIYSANCLHIMGEAAVEKTVEGAAARLKPDGVFAVYGPFNYAGNYTSESNARFDAFLKSRDSASGIRDFEWIDEMASRVNLELVQDVDMPANNRCLIWKKRTL
ncbi:MAG: class I SAM-dependent methyltransferase [Gammaproteobacteria bacterium]|nr:class I SAM-dependent methyltransferase [Gammaproteobacteria bacterium]